MNHYYVHIPFCHRVCPYCKFAVSPVVNELTKKRYLEYLKKEIRSSLRKELALRSWKRRRDGGLVASKTPIPLSQSDIPLSQGGFNTLYFGGGTPSILSIAEFKEIVDCFLEAPPRKDWIAVGETEDWFSDFSKTANPPPPSSAPPFSRRFKEVTLESNPEDITEEKVKGWISLGVNRISIGVQSLNDKTLGAIHRSTVETIFCALEIIQSCILDLASGISINIDFILGLPYSKSGETLEAIKKLHKQFPNITHTSVYILEDERYPEEWKHHYPTTEEVQTEYAQICEYLENKGWHHYEISNWAKPGYESTHNQSYWNHSDYRGFGLSAGSFCKPPCQGGKSEAKGGFSPTRFSNASNFRDYFAGKQEQEILTEEQLRIENIMFGLRTFSLDESLAWNKGKLEQFIQDGLLEMRKGGIAPTKTGIFLLDHIMGELID